METGNLERDHEFLVLQFFPAKYVGCPWKKGRKWIEFQVWTLLHKIILAHFLQYEWSGVQVDHDMVNSQPDHHQIEVKGVTFNSSIQELSNKL